MSRAPTARACGHQAPFGNRWAASKVNSLKMSTRSPGLVHLGRSLRIIGPTRCTQVRITDAGMNISRAREGVSLPPAEPDLRDSEWQVEASPSPTFGVTRFP